MNNTWADTVKSDGDDHITDPVAKDTGHWQAMINLNALLDVRASP